MIKKKDILLLLIIIAASILPYLSSLPNEFVWDDRPLIIEDYHIRSARFLDDIFLRDFFSHSDQEIKYGYYRPVITLSYMLNLSFSGLHPFGFHIINILFHAACAGMVYSIGRRLFAKSFRAPLIASLLFAVHPIHTESVTWIAGRTDVICTFFFLLAFYLHTAKHIPSALLPPASAEKRIKKKVRDSPPVNRPSPVPLVLSLICCALALLAKEMALTLPGIIFLYEYFLRRQDYKKALRHSFPFVAIVLFYMIWRYVVAQVASNPAGVALHWSYLLSGLKTFWLYVYKLVFPVKLSAYIQNPYVTELLSLPAAVSLVLTAMLAYAIWKLPKNQALLAFLIWAFLASFVPLSNLIPISAPPDMGFPMSERFLYLPSVFFVMTLTWIVLNRIRSPHIAGILAACLVTFWAFQTTARNLDWRDEDTFFSTCLKEAPRAPLLHANLALYYSRAGRHEDAINSLHNAIKLSHNLSRSTHHGLLTNLAGVYRQAGQYDEAIAILETLEEEEPIKAVYEFNLGEALRHQGNLPEAEEAFLRALAMRPQYVEAMVGLGELYNHRGKFQEAIRFYRQALSFFPDSAELHLALGVTYKQAGNYRDAVREYQTALRINPRLALARGNLGVTYALLKDFNSARYHLEAAVSEDPTLWDAQNALGMVYAVQGKTSMAREKFQEILQADPNNVEALLNEGILLYQEADIEAARACFAEVLEIDPNHVRAQSFLKKLEEGKQW